MYQRIRQLVVIEMFLIVASMLASFLFESTLPPVLQEYLEVSMEESMTGMIGVVYIIVMVFIAAHIVALIGLLLAKLWAKNLYIYSTVGTILACFFVGAYVNNAVSFSIDQISTVVSGMIIALLVFDPSYTEAALNKSRKEIR
jgi:hypothetical protein